MRKIYAARTALFTGMFARSVSALKLPAPACAVLLLATAHADVTYLATFDGANGAYPTGTLTLSGSTLYGATRQGGASGSGTVFSIPTTGGSVTTLASFDGTNGQTPTGSLAIYGSTLYGTTDRSVFSVPTSGGSVTTLATSTEQLNWTGSVTISADGSALYGMTSNGGAFGEGSVFSVSTSGGSMTTLASFNVTNGGYPAGSLTLSGSTLYGAIGNDIFSLPATGGAITTLATMGDVWDFGSYDSFGNFTRSGKKAIGYGPRGSFLVTDTTIYGTTYGGSTLMGDNGLGYIGNGGTVFSLSISGGDTTILGYFDRSWAENPAAQLALSGSTLYGTTFEGGDDRQGTLFSLSTTGGNISTLLSFGSSDGSLLGNLPISGVTLSADGSMLYGMTYTGGDNNLGTIYSYSVAPSTSTAAVPETSTWVMGAMVTVGFFLIARRRKRAASNR